MLLILGNLRQYKQRPNAVWTPVKISERAQKIRDICAKEIKKQMKWQPSCKSGTTKWSYTEVVPNQEVFRAVMREENNAKSWKLRKISTGEFAELFGHIEASVSHWFLCAVSRSG